MPSTYTSRTGIELIATGEQSGSWGTTTNTNLQIIDRVVNGVGSISLSGTTHTLTTTDGTLSDGMYKLLLLEGSPSGTNTITISPNDQEKIYLVYNNSGESAIFTQGSGTNVTIPDGETKIIFADGAGATADVTDFTGLLKIASTKVTGLGTAAALDVGTSANNVVQLNGSAQLPAVDGSNLTGVATAGFSVAMAIAL